MRRLGRRPKLGVVLLKRLAAERNAINASVDKRAEADRRYSNARQADWFKPIIRKLKRLAKPGQRCMYCSGSEAADLEHFRPRSVYPGVALTWKNFLWSCTPCNRAKLDHFPPHTEPGGQYVNPVEEDVWDFFFIDKYGLLTPRFDPILGVLNPRAVSTRDLIDLNRDAVRETRGSRVKDLKRRVRDSIRLFDLGALTRAQALVRVATWRAQPFQPDVADYFLVGPGKIERPFKGFFDRLNV